MFKRIFCAVRCVWRISAATHIRAFWVPDPRVGDRVPYLGRIWIKSAVLDPYVALATIYDDWQERYGCFADGVLPRLETALQGFRAVNSFLDLGCGTGTLLLNIAHRYPHVRLAGKDASAAMLACARRKSGGERIEWRCEPLAAPVTDARFDAAGCFFNTLNHLDDRGALEDTLRAIAGGLCPRGWLVFDVNNPLGFQSWWRGTTVYRGPAWRMEVRSSYDAASETAHAAVRVRLEGRGTVETAVRERVFGEVEIEGALAQAGFHVVTREPWSPYPDGVPGATFWVARLRGNWGRARETGAPMQVPSPRLARRRTG
jgi:SAM-dependent methyltransferase